MGGNNGTLLANFQTGPMRRCWPSSTRKCLATRYSRVPCQQPLVLSCHANGLLLTTPITKMQDFAPAPCRFTRCTAAGTCLKSGTHFHRWEFPISCSRTAGAPGRPGTDARCQKYGTSRNRGMREKLQLVPLLEEIRGLISLRSSKIKFILFWRLTRNSTPYSVTNNTVYLKGTCNNSTYVNLQQCSYKWFFN